jgi:hypothetical protein
VAFSSSKSLLFRGFKTAQSSASSLLSSLSFPEADSASELADFFFEFVFGASSSEKSSSLSSLSSWRFFGVFLFLGAAADFLVIFLSFLWWLFFGQIVHYLGYFALSG